MNTILALCGIFLFSYTVVALLLFYTTGSEPSTLTTCVFAAVASEAGVMGWIKTAKVRRQEREWEQEDKDNEC